ncbi:MAG: glutamate 5-kinase [[Lactobacillus] timonensis]|jgi:glutamate 5-kinase|uniref:glutamate 5-kinase n=1 Tax=[Lactobacillus] timonensis TaxID=1970790 RepID=UPI002353F958|nr:glutamate 5-kinase [[Lactobacillus] timonensis]MCI1926245.1 glutamate 5-kinase [[Lactobacillus] timonensis]MCI1957613.1 glutamate 5-kinase [[Lactobacillus] timonensis]
MANKKIKRVVIKVGTSTLVQKNGQVNLPVIDNLALTLSALNNRGLEVILVSSGAMGVGLESLGLKQRPKAIAEQQALSSVGQLELMRIYSQRFLNYQTKVSQLLLTRDVLHYPVSKQHVLNTIEVLMTKRIIPIINENDPVSVDELDHHTTFSDNDELSALVATKIGADLLIILSDVDALYTADPHRNPDAQPIRNLDHLTSGIEAGAAGTSTRFGTGGMVTKLRAAKMMMQDNRQMVLCNGHDPRIIIDILKGEEVGTHFGADKIANSLEESK